MFPDGTYDVIVVDATEDPADEASVTLDLAIAGGDHRGELVTINAKGLGRDALDLLAVPATLTVADGVPSVRLDG